MNKCLLLNDDNKTIISKENKKKEITQVINPIDYDLLNYVPNESKNDGNPPGKTFRIKKRNLNKNLNKKSKHINIVANENTNHILKDNKKIKEILKKAKSIMAYNEEELKNLEYELALKFDKRTFCEYYFSLLKLKHFIIFSFYYKKDYNSKIIKIDLFFINFTLNYTVNALFFNDNTIHKIYKEEGSFNFIYQLPQIVYSTLISSIINFLFNLLALSEGQILEFKKNKEKSDLIQRSKDLNKKLNIKFILYFIISFLFLMFFWYYLSMFSAIYRKTQYHLLKDTLISFGLSIIYPFGIYLLPAIFRTLALSNGEKNRNYLYNFSKLFQIF